MIRTVPIRSTALSKFERVKPRLHIVVKSKVPATVVDTASAPSDPVFAILQDETLRKGDIVMLRDGPNVFIGRPGKVHSESDFQDTARSRALSHSTRKLLAAKVAPVGALPADEMRRYLADRGRPVQPVATVAQVSIEPQPIRVITP